MGTQAEGLPALLRRALDDAGSDPGPLDGAPAAVLIPVVVGDEPTVIFTVRSEGLRRHKGEISFPGGASHDEDPDLLTTALRETEEEIGIPADAFDIVGRMEPQHSHVSGYAVVPYVGVLSERPELELNPLEVAAVLDLPLPALARVERLVPRHWQGATYHTWEYEMDGWTVWGLTGRILHGLLETLRREGWT